MTTPKLIMSDLKFEIHYLSDKISFRSTKQEKNHKKDRILVFTECVA